ncbi:cilia- and flagella-associated protein [Histomonas meleagridis]|uniref:cilia- and flagella-associated protein 61 n=1 Tax=Histomonas meleagridis TaxID=135588 RepID=UPI00355A1331|nr:cilia- and flagella-associated protein [Histomonas meleagridis]KAH0801840.1 cilia- and flagella-associated protein 61 [Histomonas meleagridis]
MSGLSVRRSLTSDAKVLSGLIDRVGEILMSRYGRKDLPQILESSVLSLTVLYNDIPVAIANFSYPPQNVQHSYRKLMLIFYASETQHTNEAARLILRTAFESQPRIDTILTKHSPTTLLESALIPFFTEDKEYFICSREKVVPSLVIRSARVEDFDDLMPLFESEAPDLIQQYGKFFVVNLIKSIDVKCLVAEGKDGLAVGFVALEPNFDASDHRSTYDLSPFQELFTEPGIAFRIRIFFIADEYQIHARDFMRPIFSLMRESDYCLVFIPTNSPPFALAPYFIQVPSTDPIKDRFILYLCHRDSVVDIPLTVRQFVSNDYRLLEDFLGKLKEKNEILEKCNDKPELVYELFVHEIIVGFCVFDEPKPIDHQHWDIEEYVDTKYCSKHCQLRYYSISPIFQKYFDYFLVRCMELIGIEAIYILHQKGHLDDILGMLFLSIERRQGPTSSKFDKHYEQKESMHLFPLKYSMQHKYNIHTSIVIVGSTEGVSSFIYKLISVPYLYFSSIKVVCTGGNERVWVNTASSAEYQPDWLQHLHLLNAVEFLEADLAEIERDESQIILNDGTIVCYDYLILLTAKEGEIADMWMAKNFVESTPPPVSVVGDSLVAYYILSHYPGCAHIVHNPRFKLEGTLATKIPNSTVAFCDFKEVPPVLLGILERSSLVYDGGIVIDELFRTNDPKIFATGPITMFSRLYRVKNDDTIISQTEYGNEIGNVILKFVDPLIKFEEPPLIVGSDDIKNLVKIKGPNSVPKFSKKRAELYQLPNNRIFYRNGYPSAKLRCLETSKQGQAIRFFIDGAGFIQAFEYLGEADGCIYNWIKLIGYPAVLLNNMVERYDKKMISDFKEFFNEKWCSAILHDRFRKFFNALHEKLMKSGDVTSPEVQNQIRTELMQFLVENSDLLPDYYTSEDQLPPLDDDD